MIKKDYEKDTIKKSLYEKFSNEEYLRKRELETMLDEFRIKTRYKEIFLYVGNYSVNH